ncbi:hypothetical protein SUNI508_04453 [Seiridium unicorne]|uniref:Uncharacterized protein n=1 Tax=Seiridium unicorne TaxID=138068 RepID=A0ABR2V8J3_9PEZI
MPLDPKYYAKEPEPTPAPDPRTEEIRRKLAESQRRFSALRSKDLPISIDAIMDQQKQQQKQPSPKQTMTDDDIDVWHRGPRPQPSTTNFTVVSIEDSDYGHPVPCGDKECDQCYVLSVVSDFDEDEAPAFFQPVVLVPKPLNLPPKKPNGGEKSSLDKKKKSSKSAISRLSPRARPMGLSSEAQSLKPDVDSHETVHGGIETAPVRRSSVEPSQGALETYMGKYEEQKRASQRATQSKSTDETRRPHLGRVMSTKHSAIEKQVRSPLDRLQDKLTYVSLASGANGGPASPTKLEILGTSTANSVRGSDRISKTATSRETEGITQDKTDDRVRMREQSPPGTWAKETRRLIRRASEVRTPSPTLLGSEAQSTPVPDLPVVRRQSLKYTPPTKPLSRKLSFKERVARGEAVEETLVLTSSSSTPRIGKGSQPPLSKSSYCDGGSACRTGRCDPCRVMHEIDLELQGLIKDDRDEAQKQTEQILARSHWFKAMQERDY